MRLQKVKAELVEGRQGRKRKAPEGGRARRRPKGGDRVQVWYSSSGDNGDEGEPEAGVITRVQGRKFFVHYDGQESEYDEGVPISGAGSRWEFVDHAAQAPAPPAALRHR